MKKLTHWMIVLTGIAGLSLFGAACNSGDDHDHSDHEHEEHAEGEKGDDTAAAPAGDKQAAAADNYPLKVCIVSGEELGSMGDPIVIQHEGVTVKFCCDGCIDDFNEAPEKYLPKLTQAMAK